MTQTILITGAAGFIGSHLSQRLLDNGWRVIGFDNFCDFYDPLIKRSNIAELLTRDSFELIEADIRESKVVHRALELHKPSVVVHIAAMAGVRPSIENPPYYTAVNLDGTVNLLDASVQSGVRRFIFASSSSVYGNNDKVPFAEDDPVNDPISPYAATKRAGELLCHTYWHLYQLPIFCLRFFTVFGPRQRPDLAISKFLRCIAQDKSIPMYGDGTTSRDYTYIDDIIDGVVTAIDRCDHYRIYNIGGSDPVTLSDLIQTCEQVVGKAAQIDTLPMQPGDVSRTFADLTRSRAELDFSPKIGFTEGVARQWAWHEQVMAST